MICPAVRLGPDEPWRRRAMFVLALWTSSRIIYLRHTKVAPFPPFPRLCNARWKRPVTSDVYARNLTHQRTVYVQRHRRAKRSWRSCREKQEKNTMKQEKIGKAVSCIVVREQISGNEKDIPRYTFIRFCRWKCIPPLFTACASQWLNDINEGIKGARVYEIDDNTAQFNLSLSSDVQQEFVWKMLKVTANLLVTSVISIHYYLSYFSVSVWHVTDARKLFSERKTQLFSKTWLHAVNEA